MADSSNCVPVPVATLTEQFDPVAWLDRYRDAGGWWAVDADGRLGLGWTFQTEEHDTTGREMFVELECDHHKLASVYQHVLASAAA